MHYRDGTEAKVGDYVKGKDWTGKPVVGQVTQAYPGNQTCNIVVAHQVIQPTTISGSFTAGDFDLVCRDDGSVDPPAAIEPEPNADGGSAQAES